MRVADFITQFICDNGVRDIFTLTGGGIMHLTDSLACNKGIKTICLHHEQSISMAIEAYGKTSGKFGAGYFTTGPGATNAVTGLAGAWLDSVPCLFISGQVKRSDSMAAAGLKGVRQIGVQEINILPVVESLTKYAAFVDKPEDIRYHLEKALYYAKEGRPGPSWIDIPLDVQGANIEPGSLRGFLPEKTGSSDLKSEIASVAEYIESSSRPVMLIGQGIRISGAVKEFLKLVESLNIPVVTTFLGIDIMPSDHQNYVGRIGIKGDRAGNMAMQNSDLLLCIGTSLPVSEIGYDKGQFAREAKIVVVDIDTRAQSRIGSRISLAIQTDAKAFIEGLHDRLADASNKKIASRFSNWLKVCVGWREKYPVCLQEYRTQTEKISSYYFFDVISRKLQKGDVIVTDAGSTFYIGSQASHIKEGVRYITSGGLSTMGFSLPASIGVSIALGGKRVMCVTGDGSFQQNIQELQSVLHYRLPLKIFVLNNRGYLSIRTTQKKFFNSRLIGEGPESGVSFPALEKIAWAYGIEFTRFNDNNEMINGIDRVINSDSPVLCEVMIPPDEEVIPTIASEKRKDGTFISKPLEDMYPFLPREEFLKNMFIKPLSED